MSMEKYKAKGLYGEGDVYVLKTMKDWDEYEKLCRKKDPEFLKWNPNFFRIKEDFEKFIGHIWRDKTPVRYKHTMYSEYMVIGIEDNNPMADWYWIMQNVDDSRDIKYINVLTPIRNDIII